MSWIEKTARCLNAVVVIFFIKAAVFFIKAVSLFGKAVSFLGAICYWVRCHTFTRYHLLDLRDRGEGHGYRWGWMDRDHFMLLACFTLLRDFVEQEDPEIGLRGEEGHEWTEGQREAVAQQLAVEREIRALYEWWVRGRASEHAAVEALLEGADDLDFADLIRHPNFAEYSRRTDELEAKDDAQLLRLVKVRGSLWT